MRTFVSVEIPGKIKNNINKMIVKMKRRLKAGEQVKWVDKNNLHITLKFIGWIEDGKIEKMTDSLANSVKDFGAIKVSIAGLGVFPDERHPRVVWAGIDEGWDRIKQLSERIEDRLSKESYGKRENREFSPHLTIGRIKEKIDPETLCGLIEKNKKERYGSFAAKNISLMKSTLRRSGPIYEEIEQIKL